MKNRKDPHRSPLRLQLALVAAALSFLPLIAACSAPEPEASVVVYSGRNKSLIGPLLERFESEKGIRTEVRYGGTAELAATLLEEGTATPCDVFIAQDAASLGELSKAGMLKPLPAAVLGRVAPAFASPQGDWVGISGRARVVVYNPERIAEEELPKSLEEVGDPRYRGRFGVAPANASFQAHMAYYRAVKGADALAALLDAMVANEPQRYPKNSAIVEAVIRGEVDFGLVNHYYLWRALAEDPAAPGRNFTMPDPTAAFLNLAGAGVTSSNEAAVQLVEYLLADDGQRYFAQRTYEYPLVAGIEPPVDLAPLTPEQLENQIDFARIAEELEPTLEAIAASGLLQ
ncbi:MAG: extracellular solute-binding protein [Acidobacteria bacterium]|nr:MAG: extracellular solute-binding protein [Acidobacteriota bacterium]